MLTTKSQHLFLEAPPRGRNETTKLRRFQTGDTPLQKPASQNVSHRGG